MKHGSLFTGFGGWDIGARAAGLELAWGVEYEPEIAAVANANLGDHVRVADILEIDPASFERVDVIHASPPCPNFSVAKRNRGETERDIAMGSKVAEFIRHHQPRIFTLENVYGYRHSDSWAIIRETLVELGYWTDMQHVNAADFGVPQTRRRMIVRAVLGGWVPHLPNPEPWIGWYAAIEDLLHTLPPSQFAPWQIKRLPVEIRDFIAQVQGEHSAGTLGKDQPAPTVTAAHVPAKYRAMLMGGANTSDASAAPGVGVIGIDEPTMTVNSNNSDSRWRAMILAQGGYDGQVGQIDGEEPIYTITANSNMGAVKAILVDGLNTTRESTTVGAAAPSFTVVSSQFRRPSTAPKAILVGNNANATSGTDIYKGPDAPADTVRTAETGGRELRALLVNSQGAGNEWSEIFQEADQPVNTITSTEGDKGRKKALLIDGKTSKTGTTMQTMYSDEPARTVVSSDAARRDSRAMNHTGRVVAMTPRAIARFQTFPDWYELPDSKKLAARGIGNAVPCLLAEKVLTQLLESIT